MWVFLSARLRRWAFAVLLLPVGRAGARRLAQRLERDHGPTRLSNTVRRIAGTSTRTLTGARRSGRRGRLTTGRDS